MLAGLIFATEDADDRPATLAATLPFGGMTLLEYQVRLLVGAGASHILVAVTRVTPALLGAVSRAARRGAAVDIVRSAEEAAARVHPLARLLVLADGLVTTDDVISRMSGEGREALLVTRDAASAVERVDADHVWAGVARIPSHRLVEVAGLPSDYDFQSSLLRLIAQEGPEQVLLPTAAVRSGHGVERHAVQLASRSYAVLAALTERRTSWADRHVFTRVARFVLPRLVAREIPGWLLPLGAGLFGIVSLGLLAAGWQATGVALSLPATALLATGAALSALRGEDDRILLQERLIGLLSALVIMTLGAVESNAQESATALTLAVATVLAAAIAERAPAPHRRWWASPAAYPLLLTPFAALGYTTLGLTLAAGYAFLTLAAAVEAARQKP